MIRFQQFLFTILLSTPVLAFSALDFRDSMISSEIRFKGHSLHVQVPISDDSSLGLRKSIQKNLESTVDITMYYYIKGIDKSSWFVGYNFVPHVSYLDAHYPEFGYKKKYENGLHYTWSMAFVSSIELPTCPGFSIGYQL